MLYLVEWDGLTLNEILQIIDGQDESMISYMTRGAYEGFSSINYSKFYINYIKGEGINSICHTFFTSSLSEWLS